MHILAATGVDELTVKLQQGRCEHVLPVCPHKAKKTSYLAAARDPSLLHDAHIGLLLSTLACQ